MVCRQTLVVILALVPGVIGEECCLCGSTCETVTDEDTYVVAHGGGFGTCAQLEWYLLINALEGDFECSRYQELVSPACCYQTIKPSKLRSLQWEGHAYIAQTGTWDDNDHTSRYQRTQSYQSWDRVMAPAAGQPAVQWSPPVSASKPDPTKSKPNTADAASHAPYNPVQVINTNPTSPSDLPPIVNTWGSANQLSEFDGCMVHARDNSVSNTFCSICADPTNYSRGVVVNDKIAGGHFDFTASCGDLNAAFKCAGVSRNDRICGIAVYGYSNQCGCRQFDNNSEEYFGFATANDRIGKWVAWSPGHRPSG